MNPRSDILIRGSDGSALAIVEVKNRLNLSRDVARELRRNILSHDGLQQIPYFLLLSQDSGFLWAAPASKNPDSLPSFEFPMEKVFLRYLSQADLKERLRGTQLELLVLHWLNELAAAPVVPAEEPEKSLSKAGFLDTIQGATVIAEDSYARLH